MELVWLLFPDLEFSNGRYLQVFVISPLRHGELKADWLVDIHPVEEHE
jgi:hypothetical protein